MTKRLDNGVVDGNLHVTGDLTVDGESPSGGSQTLDEVLQQGNDAGGAPIQNLAEGSNPSDAATVSQTSASATLASVLNESNDAAGNAIIGLDSIEIDGNLNHDGTAVGFYGTTPATRASVPQIADPSSATAEDVATAFNGLVVALGLGGVGLVSDS